MNVVLLSASTKGADPNHTVLATKTMQAQLIILGLAAHHTTAWHNGMPADVYLVAYRTDHELSQIKRVAAAHKQHHIMVLDNIRVLPEGTIAQGGLEFYTRPSDGYYHGEHVEQLIEFHLSRPPGDCTQLPAEYGGLYITVRRS